MKEIMGEMKNDDLRTAVRTYNINPKAEIMKQ